MLSVVINYYVVKGWKLEEICSFHVFLLVQEWKFGFLFLFYNILFHSTQDYRRLPTSYMKKNCKSGYKNFVCPQQGIGIEKTVRGNLILFLIKKNYSTTWCFKDYPFSWKTKIVPTYVISSAVSWSDIVFKTL